MSDQKKEFHLYDKPRTEGDEPFLVFQHPCVASKYAELLDLELVPVFKNQSNPHLRLPEKNK